MNTGVFLFGWKVEFYSLMHMDMGGRRWEEVGGGTLGGGGWGGQRQGGMRCIMHIIFHEEQTVFCSLTVAVDIPNTNVGKQGGE